MKKNYKLQNTKEMAHELHELTQIPEKKDTGITITKGGHGLHKGSFKLQTMTAFNQKLLRGGLNQWISGSVGQWVSSMIGKRGHEPLIMVQRPHPETNENQHKRFAQHIGPPCHGAPGDEEPPPVLKSWRNLYILVIGNLLLWIVLFTLFTWMFK